MSIKIRTLPAFILCACLLVLPGSAPASHAAGTNLRVSSETRALQTDAGVIHYVAPGGTGDCTSWAAACDLQDALVAAVSGDEIWAAAGTYKPTTDTTNRVATFQLKAEVAIYGGFAGTETSREARDPATHVTVLSGDIDSNDSQSPITDLSTVTNNGTNSYHVVTGATGALLDGVTITGGTAKGTIGTVHANGGGMYNASSSPALTNVTFTGNEASLGGAMYNDSSSPTLTNVTFSKNAAGSSGGGMYNINNSSPVLTGVAFNGNRASQGGGMYNRLSSSPTLTGVTFTGNQARYGGGMYNSASSPQLTDVTFSGNNFTDSQVGGGMYNYSSSPTLTNVTFNGNWAPTGGGMANDNKSSPTLTNVTFNGNSATDFGGGMFNSSSSPALSSVTFIDNSTSRDGGGMYNASSSPALTNVTFTGNRAAEVGGGMYNVGSSSTLTNVTFSGNTASRGGGIYNSYGGSPVIRNTILWDDTGGEVVNSDATSAPTITASVVQGGCPAGATCPNLIDADPRLGALGDYGGATETIPLLPGSSAIDAGDDGLCPATDQRGVARPQGAHCDIGAFEYDYAGIYYVMPGGSGSRDGQSWANAGDLQNVLRTSRGGDEIWAAAGVYKPATDPADRTATFLLKAGVAIYGGFAGTETSREARDPAANVTILSGDIDNNDSQSPITDLSTVTNNGENSYHVVTGADGAILDGVTITAGNANEADDLDKDRGGGMYNDSSSPTLSNVTFTGNSAWVWGGGMYSYSSSPTLSNVTFSGNSAGSYGGGMYNYYSSSPTLTNITFSSNVATESGGGMANSVDSNPTLTNVTFSLNRAEMGGGMHNDSSGPTLIGVTFSGNSANSFGGGMVNLSSSPLLRSTILWGDTGGEVVNHYSLSTITSSVVQGGCPADATCTNVIDADPRLGALGDYGGDTQTIPLLLGSSAIDAGDDTLCPATDQRGVARPQGAHCDIGAFEKELATVALSDLSYTYDGQGKSATVTTEPAELAVVVTYGGSADLPVNAGEYAVVAAIDNILYQGSASGTLTIQKRPVTVAADAKTKVTGEPDPDLTYQVTSGSLVAGDAFSGALTRDPGETVGTYPIRQGTLALSDNYALTFVGAELTITAASNTAPVANPGGPYLGAINTAIVFDGSASSSADGDALTYAWDFGDSTMGDGAFPSHSYTAAGIYDVCLTVTDGLVDSDPTCTLAVAYDPSGGFVTGGGWIDSPAGAYVPDSSLAGRATFGFVSKYKKGQSVPTGNTEFQFAVAGFSFHSETYEWLLINKTRTNAQFKGSGTVNGGLDPNGNAYKFMIWAGDGTPDTFRIKIWWEDNGTEVIVYDNGAEQAIGGGSIVIHTK